MKLASKYGFLLASSSAAVLAGSMTGQAADLPMKARVAAPAAVAPPATWAGAYIGLHGGAVWQQAHTSDSYAGYWGDLPYDHSASDTGGIFGGQIGYNWQNGNAVYGVEVDGSWVGGKPSYGSYGYGYSGNHFGKTESKIEWLSTVRGRMGLAVGNAMAYATAGLAIGGVKTKTTIPDWEGFAFADSTKTKLGWVVGAGLEHKVSSNFTIGLEGLFVDLGKTSTKASPGSWACCDKVGTLESRNQMVIGRFKANYKF
jgi:outer membrane immunogenic protein